MLGQGKVPCRMLHQKRLIVVPVPSGREVCRILLALIQQSTERAFAMSVPSDASAFPRLRMLMPQWRRLAKGR